MRPHELIGALLEQEGLKVLTWAKRMGRPNLQPQLHRFLKGEVANPARSTAQAIAGYFNIPIDAVYDERVATVVAQERLTNGGPPPSRVPHWRRVANAVADALQERQRTVEAVKFLAAVDAFADLIDPAVSDDVMKETVERHLTIAQSIGPLA